MRGLSPVRVLDLTRFLAGPFCTSMLADMGADVVKVEAPKGGDEGRYGYPPVDGVPVFFTALNRNKRGITLDLRTDDEMVLKLIERSRLLIALSEEIPTETKLQTQPLLKQLEQLLAFDDRDVERIQATHALLCRELQEFADLDALLGAMENFLPR